MQDLLSFLQKTKLSLADHARITLYGERENKEQGICNLVNGGN